MDESPGPLIYDLGTIQKPDDAIAFIGRHGMLRHGPASERPRRERWTGWLEFANGFRAALQADMYARRAGQNDAAALEWVTRNVPGAGKAPDAMAAVSAANAFVAEFVTIGLTHLIGTPRPGADLGLAYQTEGESGYVLTVEPNDLIQRALCELALVLVRGVPTRACENCGALFSPKDARQRFHSEACATQGRFQRWKRRRINPRGGQRGKTRTR